MIIVIMPTSILIAAVTIVSTTDDPIIIKKLSQLKTLKFTHFLCRNYETYVHIKIESK